MANRVSQDKMGKLCGVDGDVLTFVGLIYFTVNHFI